jgi:hypothetical protein
MNMAADRILAGPIAAGNMQGVPSSKPSNSRDGRRHDDHPYNDPPSASDGLPVGLRTPDLPQYSSTTGSQRSAGGHVLGTMERQQAERLGPGKMQGVDAGAQSPLRKGGEPASGGYGKGGEVEKVESVKGGCCLIM